MAEDYLTDDEQLEAVKHWLVENGPWLLGGALLGGALLFGYRFYESHSNGVALRAAAEFDQMTSAIDKHDVAGARRVAEELIGKYAGSPYADQAELALASLSVNDGRLAAAVPPLTRVIDHSKDSELKKVARLRLARVQIAEGKPDLALATLSGGEPGAFASLYHEVRGDALSAKHDNAGAIAEYRSALATTDPRYGDSALLSLKIADLGAAPAAGKAVP